MYFNILKYRPVLRDPLRNDCSPRDRGQPHASFSESVLTVSLVSPWAVHLSSGNVVITEQGGELKKEPGRAGLNHMSDAGKTSGTHERTRRRARQKGKPSRPRWHLGAIITY